MCAHAQRGAAQHIRGLSGLSSAAGCAISGPIISHTPLNNSTSGQRQDVAPHHMQATAPATLFSFMHGSHWPVASDTVTIQRTGRACMHACEHHMMHGTYRLPMFMRHQMEMQRGKSKLPPCMGMPGMPFSSPPVQWPSRQPPVRVLKVYPVGWRHRRRRACTQHAFLP
jgi:hypothetical protein